KTQHCKHKLEIIPYNQFTDITYVAKGGFSEIYEANCNTNKVALKIYNDINIYTDVLNE
ncbi:20120_t:CDS:1, partial [Gigaspora rosea]